MKAMNEVSSRSGPVEFPGSTRSGSTNGSFNDLLTPLLKATRESASAPVPQAVPQENQAPPRLTVRQGDTLSRLCADHLQATGHAVSQPAISAAVSAVATANAIKNPDRIYVGQSLDLSVLETGTQPPKTSQEGPGPVGPPAWKALVNSGAALSSGFGLRRDPFTGQVRRHEGIDIAAPAASPVLACAPGQVSFAGWEPGYGNTVILRHEGGLESRYSHLSKTLVQVGEDVAGQEPIAQVGSTGRSTGAHLHFEIRRNGAALNPLHLLASEALKARLSPTKT